MFLPFAIPLTYIWASIPWGLVIARLMGQRDPRTMGSGNIGATNTYRTSGWPAALLVALCDGLKGLIPVMLTHNRVHGLIIGLVAVLGHIFPCTLKFKGGKGVATALGILIALYPAQSVFLIVLWGILIALTKYVSLASLVAILTHGILSLFSHPQEIWFSGCLIVLIFYAHRANIFRLLSGKEQAIR